MSILIRAFLQVNVNTLCHAICGKKLVMHYSKQQSLSTNSLILATQTMWSTVFFFYCFEIINSQVLQQYAHKPNNHANLKITNQTTNMWILSEMYHIKLQTRKVKDNKLIIYHNLIRALWVVFSVCKGRPTGEVITAHELLATCCQRKVIKSLRSSWRKTTQICYCSKGSCKERGTWGRLR